MKKEKFTQYVQINLTVDTLSTSSKCYRRTIEKIVRQYRSSIAKDVEKVTGGKAKVTVNLDVYCEPVVKI